MLQDKDRSFFKELVKYHISGQLKVAPEHCVSSVLDYMGKPHFDVFLKFWRQYQKLNEEGGTEQYLVPYLMSSHPGCTLSDAVELAEFLHKNGRTPEQVQDFYPTPGTLSTCMYYTGIDPRDMSEVYVARDPKEKAMQRALLQWSRPEKRALVVEALEETGLTIEVPSKLVFYGFLLFIVKLIIFLIYVLYNFRYYEEVHLNRIHDFSMCKKQLAFSFWSFWGALGYTFSQQGLNMLLNMFFGATVNAARGIAVQVNSQLGILSSNYQVAVNPQIVKTYASGKIKTMYRLVFDNIRISFLLNWLVVLPLLFVMDDIFALWLVKVPDNAVLFCKIIMLRLLLTPYENPFNVVNGATGNNKVFGFMSGVFLNITLPLCYILFLFERIPWMAFCIDFVVYFSMILWKLIYLHRTAFLPYRKFFYRSLFPNIMLMTIGLGITYFIWQLFAEKTLVVDVLIVIVSTFTTVFLGYHFSLDSQMRQVVKNKIIRKNN